MKKLTCHLTEHLRCLGSGIKRLRRNARIHSRKQMRPLILSKSTASGRATLIGSAGPV